MTEPELDPRFMACVDLLARSGATNFQFGFQDEMDPIAWVAIATWPYGSEAAGGLTPLVAVFRLVEAATDGGACAHCGRAAGVSADWESQMPLDELICWHVYDPETQKFRRSCEGETTGRAFGRNPETGEVVGRNDPCPCNSGKKWKHCHGQ